MSANSFSAPLSSASSSSSSAAGVGLGYGIAIAVGLLVLVSTIMLASYVCVRVKGSSDGPRSSSGSAPAPSSSSSSTGGTPSDAAAAFVVLGLHGLAIEAYYPKFVYKVGGGAPAPAGPCPICLAEYDDGEALRRVPECGHCFHAVCVDEWLRVSATCPLCRSSPVPSASATPVATPLSELIPLAVHAR